MTEKVFEVQDVFFSYMGKFPALREVTVSIAQGQRVAVIGANGSGKSTLLHMLDGLIFPEQGSVKAFGQELGEGGFNDRAFSRSFRMRVGLVFQNPDVQLFCPTVEEDIMFGPLQLGIGKDRSAKRLEQLIAMLGIQELLSRSPHQLSVGEKRKVAIASTLIMDPQVLILDEPTAGLDPLTTRHILDLLISENGAGKTIITSTHDLHIVEEIADTVHVFSYDKKIVASGTPEAIMKDAALLEAHNLVHVHAHRHKDTVHVHPHEHPTHDHSHGA